MNLIRLVLLIFILLPAQALSETKASYFQLGEWTLGEKSTHLLSAKSPFKNVEEVVKRKEYDATVDTIFASNTPAKLFFKNQKLHRLELSLYEGPEYSDASAAAKLIISELEKNFDGAFLEGYTTSEGLTPEIFDVVVGQLLEKSEAAIAEVNAEEPESGGAYFNLFISLSTEYQAKGNFIYGKFSYFGDRKLYTVTVYEDQKFNKDHVAPAMIHIESLK